MSTVEPGSAQAVVYGLGAPAPGCRERVVIATVDLGPLADLVTVDRLARLHLAAGRAGAAVELHDASPALADLLALVGLGGLLVEMDGEAERCELLRAEEAADAGDPAFGGLDELDRPGVEPPGGRRLPRGEGEGAVDRADRLDP